MPYRRNNFDFVVDSSFQPFSMQELLTPFVMYKEEYDKQSAAFDELSEKAGDMKYFAQNLPEGSRARQIYDTYANDLKAQADEMARNGLSVNSRRALTDLKRRYAGEIGMLEKANTLRMAQMKEQHDLGVKDPTLLFSREAKFSSLDDYLDNPDLTYQSYSGALLAKQVNDAAASISKSLVDYMNGKPLDGNTRTWLQQHGLTAMEVAQAIANPQSMQSSKVLNTLMSSVMESSGITSWADPATLKRAYLYASQGLWKAIGEDKVSTYSLPKATTGSKTTQQQPVVIPQLTTGGGQQQTPQKPAGNSGSGSKNGRPRRKYGMGGNLYGEGGPEDEVSPQLRSILKSMSDDDYHAFMTEQTGTQNYTEAQQDSVVKAYDKQLAESMQAQYMRKLFEESYPEVQQVSPSYNPRNVLTTIEGSQMAHDTEMMKKYGKYFYKTKNGHYAMNAKGRSEYASTPYVYRGPYAGYGNGIIPSKDDEFKRWIDRNGLTEMAKGRTGSYQSQVLQGIMNRVNQKYDANLATEYYRPLDSDQYQDILGQLNILATDGQLPKYERVKQNGTYTFKAKNDKVDVSDIKDKVRGVAAVYGQHGNYLEVALKGGEKIYVPFNMINSYYDQIVQSNMARAMALQGLQKKGSKVTLKSDGKTVEPIELSIIRALNAAGNNMISAFSTSGAKKQEVERNTYR